MPVTLVSSFVPPAPRRARGFTLIELLTVIAIIGILAAILIPTIGKVREMARFSKGTANLREMARAALLFADEHKGAIPHEGGGTVVASNVTLISGVKPWWNELPPYMGFKTMAELNAQRAPLPKLGDNHPFVCPNASVNSSSTAAAWACYGLSLGLSDSSRLFNLSKVRDNASRVVLFAETTNHAPGQTGSFSNSNPRYLGQRSATANGSRWGDKSLVSFFDGSVRGYKQSDLARQGDDLTGVNYNGPIWSPAF